MSESKDKREGRTPKRDPRAIPVPRENEPWINEGGTARYPEGFKIRGHDANALLDRADGLTDPEEPTKQGPEGPEAGAEGAKKADAKDDARP